MGKEHMIRADTVRFETHEDPMTGDTVITADIKMCYAMRISRMILQDYANRPDLLVSMSNDIHGDMLRGMREGMIGSDALAALNDLRRAVYRMMDSVHGHDGYVAFEYAMQQLERVENTLLKHPADRDAFTVNQDTKPNGEAHFDGSTKQARQEQMQRPHREIPEVPRGRRQGEAKGAIEYAPQCHTPSLDAPSGETPEIGTGPSS